MKLKSMYACASEMAIRHVMLIFMWHYLQRSERIAFSGKHLFYELSDGSLT